MVTDLHTHYQEPEIRPPVRPDKPGIGKPSDHDTPVSSPITNWGKSNSRPYDVVEIQRIPLSKMDQFGQWIVGEPFSEVYESKTSTEKVEKLQSIIKEKTDTIFPMKKVKMV